MQLFKIQHYDGFEKAILPYINTYTLPRHIGITNNQELSPASLYCYCTWGWETSNILIMALNFSTGLNRSHHPAEDGSIKSISPFKIDYELNTV